MFAAGAFEYRRRGLIGSQSAPLLVFGGLVIALMIGFRYEVGGDWHTYEELFAYASYLDFWTNLATGDPGYSLLNWLGNRIGAGIWFVNLACGLIFSWGLIRFARRQTNPWLAVLVGIPYLVIVVAMGYTRQGVAIGIVLAGLSVLDRTSVVRFGGYILLAAAFHKSAIVVLPLVALAASRNRVTTAALMFVLAILLYVFLVRSSLDKMMTNYVEAEYSSQGAAIRVAMNLPPALLFLLFQRRFESQDTTRKLWRNFSLAALATLALLVLTASSTAVDRVALYLIPLQLYVLARLPEAFPNKGRPNGLLLMLVILYLATIQFVWLNYATHAEFWLPYKLMLVDESDPM
jgi:hypothetical protein